MHGREHEPAGLIKRLLVAALLLTGGAQTAAAQEDGGPEAVVERLNAALLDVMKSADELGYSGRYERLEPVLEETFHFALMARLATGRAWNEFSDEERERVVELFADMSIANYAARFDDYGGEQFEIEGQRPGPRDSVLVQTDLVRTTNEPVGIDYLVREFDDGEWRIIDVFLDSKFSELARQRSEFSSVLRDGGYSRLVATIQDKIAELADGDTG